ncbi:MAG: DUF2812 domain-containing protein [Lachnospiraceae bacterium]|nr:DUF2812 domain-containing protein [Lachnospiraceae bacterium]
MKIREHRYEMYTLYSYYDRAGMEEHLEKMASKGWMLERMNSWFWTYRKCPPKKVHVQIIYDPNASEYAPEPTRKQEDFRDFCEYAGWDFTASYGPLQVFYHVREAENRAEEPVRPCVERRNPEHDSEKWHPIPIETDPVMEVEVIHQVMKKRFLPINVLLLVNIFLAGRKIFPILIEKPLWAMANLGYTCIACSIFLAAVMIAVEIVSYFLWLFGARRMAERNQSLVLRGRTLLRRSVFYLMVFSLIYWFVSVKDFFLRLQAAGIVFLAACALLVSASVSRHMKKKKVSADENRVKSNGAAILAMIVSAVFLAVFLRWNWEKDGFRRNAETEVYEYQGTKVVCSHDRLPVMCSELLVVDDYQYRTEWDVRESPLLAQHEAKQYIKPGALGNEGYLDYTITEVKLSVMNDWCRQMVRYQYERMDEENPLERKYRFVETDADLWGAEYSCQIFVGEEAGFRHLVFWDGCILDLAAGWQLTGDQKGIIGAKIREFMESEYQWEPSCVLPVSKQ